MGWFKGKGGKFQANRLLRILLEKTKNPLFMGFVGRDEKILWEYAINPIQNTKF